MMLAKSVIPRLLLLLPCSIVAFSSIGIPSSPSQGSTITFPNMGALSQETCSVPWRVVLDIGREPLSTMPFDWARSGCRMPLVIPCNVLDNKSIEPRDDTVSFTGPDGAVVRPIEGGTFNLRNERNLEFELYFPSSLIRRDVTIEAGTTLQCTGTVYTKSELDRLNQEFYQARDEAWKIGGQLNEMAKLDGAPKRWNESTQQWEMNRSNVNPLSWVQKRLQYAAAKAKQGEAHGRRPDPRSLSEQGQFPGVKDDVFVGRGAMIKSQKGAVMGSWSMEPMLDRPVSYYR